MGFLDSLLSGVVGFATGGPIVGGATFLSGLLSDDGGGGRNAINLNRDVDVDYLDVLQRQAAFEGYQQGYDMAGPGVQSGGRQQASGGQQGQSQGGPGTQLGSSRNAGLRQFANQRGGQNSGGSATEAQQNIAGQEAGTMPSVNLQDAYRSYLAQGLMGQDTLPDGGAQAAQMQAGMNTIDAQTQRAREQYLQQMSNRGLLRSGMTSTGMAEIESGRAQSLGQLSADLERQRQQQLLQTQQNAAAAIGNQQMRQAELAAAEPTWGETLGGGLQAYAQYEAMRNAPDPYGQMLLQLFNQQGLAPQGAAIATPATQTPYAAGSPVGPTTTDPQFGARTTMPSGMLTPNQPGVTPAPLARERPPALGPRGRRPTIPAEGRARNWLYD